MFTHGLKSALNKLLAEKNSAYRTDVFSINQFRYIRCEIVLMPQIFYAPEASNDLVGIAEHIARDKPEAARRWVKRLCETCEMLATNPEAGELRAEFGVPGCRSFSKGNYVIFYRAAKNGIEVARIVHWNRDLNNL